MSESTTVSMGPDDPAAPWNRTFSSRQIARISTMCFLAMVFAVYDFTLFGTLLPVIAAHFGWSDATAAAINTYVSIGVLIVSLAIGILVDRLGRRWALIVTVIGAALSSGLTGMVAGAATLILIRALSAFGYGVEVVNSVYLNEVYAKVRRRGFFYSIVQSGWPIGALVSAGLTALLLPSLGWRLTFVVAMIPAIFIAIAALWLPESPTWAGLREIRRLRGIGDNDTAVRLAHRLQVDDGTRPAARLRDLIEPGLRQHTICLSLAWLFNWMAIQIFGILGTTVLTQGKGISFDSSLIVLVMANAVGFAGYLVHGAMGDVIGRRTTIIGGWLIGSVVTVALLLGPSNATYVFVMYAASIFFLNGPYAALLFYMGESFPARVRGIGTNIAHVMGPVGSILGSGLLAILLAAGTEMVTAALIAGSLFMFLSALVMFGARKGAAEEDRRVGDHIRKVETAVIQDGVA